MTAGKRDRGSGTARDPGDGVADEPAGPAGDLVPTDDERAPAQADVPPAQRRVGEGVLTEGHNTEGQLTGPRQTVRQPGDAHEGDARGAPALPSLEEPGPTERAARPGVLDPARRFSSGSRPREDPHSR